MRYRIGPENKKCSMEVQTFIKDNKTITITTAWRYAIFECESDTKPVLLQGQDIYETLDNVNFIEASDGDVYYDYEGMTEEEIDAMDEWFGDNSFCELEEEGWLFGDNVWYYDCPVEIEEIGE